MAAKQTLTGKVDDEVLSFTVGKDPDLDLVLVESDCAGTAAHAVMLSRMGGKRPVLTKSECRRILRVLSGILKESREGKFTISASDQDVHMAVEKVLTRRLGTLGKKVHTGRSRNDQVAVDMRLYTRSELGILVEQTGALASALLVLARKHKMTPMVGRTHFQPAMPSTVGVWASAYAEGLLEDIDLLMSAYRLNNRCPLGAAAGYGVPLRINRKLTARLLGFSEPVHNVLHAIHGRGKCESVVLFAAAQVMLTICRLAEDLVLFSAPEFSYFRLPSAYCTGSSIMPQKQNPDVMELVRARTARVMAHTMAAMTVLKGLPSGYNRDLQETKEPLIEGLRTAIASTSIMARVVKGLSVNRRAMAAGFGAGVFAADRALELVAKGIPFRDAYNRIKKDWRGLGLMDPAKAVARKRHLGAPGGLDLNLLEKRLRTMIHWAAKEERRHRTAIRNLVG